MQRFRATFKKLQEMFARPNLDPLGKEKVISKACDRIPRILPRDIRLRWVRSKSECLVETKQRLFEVLVNSLTFAKHTKATQIFQTLIGRSSLNFM